jgi:hypothetical protein
VHRAFRFLSVLECDSDLVPKLRALVFLQSGHGLGEIVLEEVEEGIVVSVRDT